MTIARGPAPTRQTRRGVLLVGLAALVPLLGFAGFALITALGAYRTVDEERLQYTARAVAAAVDAQLGVYITALEMLATSRLLDGPVDAQAFEARARDASERLGGGIVLIDAPPGYQMLANTLRQLGAPLPRAVHPEGETALAGVFAAGLPHVSDLFTGAVTGRPTLAVMVPVDRPEQPRRVLALAVTPSALSEALAQQGLPPGTFAAIADGQVRLLAHSVDRYDRFIGVAAPGWLGSVIAGRQRTLISGPGWSGPDNVYAVERLTRAPNWVVGVYQRRAVQQASAWAAVRWLIAGSAALGLGLVVVVWASRREAVRDARREATALRAGRAEVERLLGGLPAVIFLREVKPDGSSRLIYRGGNLEAVLGWPIAELAKREDFDDLVHPEDTPPRHLGTRLLQDRHISHEWRIRQPGGGWRPLYTLAQVLVSRPDGGAEIVGYTVDVSARRRAEAQADAAQRELEQTLKYAPVAVFRGRVWPDGSYLRSYMSPAIERLTGWPMERMKVPGQLSQLLAPEDRAATPDYMRDLMRNGTACRDRRLQHADGRWMVVRMEMSVIGRYEDESVEAVGYILDVTAEREAEGRALASARLASLGEMAAGLAHEIKQPLQSISLAAEVAQLAARGGNARIMDERLERIVEETQRTSELIERLRRFARGAEDGAPLQAVPLAAAVHGALDLARGALRDAVIDVEVALGEPAPVVRGQAVLLEQVLSNLLLNARDALAARPAGALRQIRIAAAPGPDGTVRLTVADTGGGIAPEVMARLFEPFVTTKGPDKGTGLGLSICHGLVTGMGGTIEAHNEAEGAVFTITLPQARSNEAPAPQGQEAPVSVPG